MVKQLVINVIAPETRVALLEDDTVVELFVERERHLEVSGNIYKARVQRVMPGMQAAFVDIGMPQAAFMHVDDVAVGLNGYGGSENHTAVENEVYPGKPVRPIEELITENQELMVQIVKSPIGTKGARVTNYITLPGRFLVFMPFSSHVGVSKRIESADERERLKNLISSMRPTDQGFIARTVSEGAPAKQLQGEMRFLQKVWDTVQGRYRALAAPSLVHRELSISLRAIRDLMTHEVQKVVIDDLFEYESVNAFLDLIMPSMKEAVELYEGNEPIFDAFQIEGDISRALKRRVWLKSGGYVVIERTEALVAIDVNTGRYLGKHNLEDTILKTNLEAVREIAYQVRLRNIGGIIIIDFIDMTRRNSQKKVFEALQEALKKDRSKTHVLPLTELGLVQMTRKRTRKSLSGILCEMCACCEGEGTVVSRRTVCYHIYRQAMNMGKGCEGDRLIIKVASEIAAWFHDEEGPLIMALERHIRKHIVIEIDEHFHREEFEFIEQTIC